MAKIDLLLSQIDSLSQQLARVETAIQSEKLDAGLRARVGARFDLLLSQSRREIADLRRQAAGGGAAANCWQEFAKIEAQCRGLFDECLAFIQGALARAAGVDGGICAQADRLLDELAALADIPWNRFTLLDTGEFYRETAEIIRVRFPELSFWELPVAAHEFGHFVGPRLWERENGRMEYPFQKMLDAADAGLQPGSLQEHTKEWRHLHEHFADLFAAYSLGPAYACSFILLRLNPLYAGRDGPAHPSAARRVHAILWALRRMDEAEAVFRPFREVIEMLQDLWNQALDDAGQPAQLGDIEIYRLQEKLEKLFAILQSLTPARLAYGHADWLRAGRLSTGLLEDRPPRPAEPDPAVTHRDVLNAAWYSRLLLGRSAAIRLTERDIRERAEQLYQAAPGPQVDRPRGNGR